MFRMARAISWMIQTHGKTLKLLEVVAAVAMTQAENTGGTYQGQDAATLIAERYQEAARKFNEKAYI